MEEEAPAAEVEVQEMSVLDALKDVLKRALVHGGLRRGLREVAKALDSRQAKLCTGGRAKLFFFEKSYFSRRRLHGISASQPRRRRDPPPRANATERLVNLAGCLAKDCDNAEYSRLVRALCDEGGVNLVMVDEGKQLGEWAGLCKIDQDGEPKGVVRCSAACVTEFGEDTHALSVLLNYLKSQAPEES